LIAVDAAANKVTFDAPITTALEANFGGATVTRSRGRIGCATSASKILCA